MAADQISAIYTALQALSITVGSKTPTVYGLTGIPNSVVTAQLPCRILEIFDNRLQTVQAKPSTITGSVQPNLEVTWAISDLLLWTPEAQGRGIVDVASNLVAYCGLYLDMIRAHVQIVSTAIIEDCKPIPGIYEYPMGSGMLYFGVLSVLSIKERVQ